MFNRTESSWFLCARAIISRLTRLSFIKGTISRTKRVGSLVADFGISGSFKSARASAELLYNIQSLLSETDLDKIVDYASANSQIQGSWESMKYLEKMPSSLEEKFGKEKIEELQKKFSHIR